MRYLSIIYILLLLSCGQEVDYNKNIENHYNNIINANSNIEKRIESLKAIENIVTKSLGNKEIHNTVKDKAIYSLTKAYKLLEKRANLNDIIVILKIGIMFNNLADNHNNKYMFLSNSLNSDSWIEKEKVRRLKEAKKLNRLRDWDKRIYGKWRNIVSEFKEQYSFFDDGSFNYIKVYNKIGSSLTDENTRRKPLPVVRKGKYIISKEKESLKLIFVDKDNVINYNFIDNDRLILNNNNFFKVKN